MNENRAKKQWNRPELVRLGRMTDVASVVSTKTEGLAFKRS